MPRIDDVNGLRGRNALVTGGSGRVGSVLARALAVRGINVVLTYRNRPEPAQVVAEEARALGVRAYALRSDLGTADAAIDLVAAAEAELGSIDILVVNGVTSEHRPWQWIDAGLWSESLRVNLNASFQLTQLTLGAMALRGYGRILYVSSIARPTGGRPVGPHHVAVEAGLSGLVHHLAPEVAPYGVTVNAIAPGSCGPEPVAGLATELLRSPDRTNEVLTLAGS